MEHNDFIPLLPVLSTRRRPLVKVLLWPPFLVGSLLTFGVFAAARSTAGMRSQQRAFASWKEQRRAEMLLQNAMTDAWEFRPLGESAADRARARAREAEETRAWEERASAARAERARRTYASSASSSSSTRRGGGGTASASAAAGGGGGAGGRVGGAGKATGPPPPVGKKPPPVNPDDFYAVLGVPRSASEDDVKAAFRRELFRYHPDHAVDSGMDPAACSERTRVIIKAYGTLRDAKRRAEYDRGRR